MNVSLDSAPKCQISADGTHIILGDWTNSPGSSSDARKNLHSVGQQSKGGLTNNALSSAISSNLNGSGGSSVNKTNLSPDEVFLNSIKPGTNAAQSGPSHTTSSVSHLGQA